MNFNRRTLLRGSCQRASPSWGCLSSTCFLNSKGQAQTNGRPLPTRFNTFFWGCGLTASLWIPKKAGTDWDMTVQLKPLDHPKEAERVQRSARPARLQTQRPALVRPGGRQHRHSAVQEWRVRVKNDRPAGG